MILKTPLTRLIGRKSVSSIAPEVFGIRAMKIGIEAFHKFAMSMKIRKDPHDISPDHIPAVVEESHGEAIRTWSLISVHTFHHL
jgi:hypothetical protein